MISVCAAFKRRPWSPLFFAATTLYGFHEVQKTAYDSAWTKSRRASPIRFFASLVMYSPTKHSFSFFRCSIFVNRPNTNKITHCQTVGLLINRSAAQTAEGRSNDLQEFRFQIFGKGDQRDRPLSRARSKSVEFFFALDLFPSGHKRSAQRSVNDNEKDRRRLQLCFFSA